MNLQQLISMPATRREFLNRSGTGLGALGLASVIGRENLVGKAAAASVDSSALSPMMSKPSHFEGKAKHVIHIFLNGGPSHVDTFDRKPLLDKYSGQALPTPNLPTERKPVLRWDRHLNSPNMDRTEPKSVSYFIIRLSTLTIFV